MGIKPVNTADNNPKLIIWRYALNNKKTNNSLKHLEDALYRTPPASANDFTGYMPSHTESEDKCENISELLNVPTSKPKHTNKR